MSELPSEITDVNDGPPQALATFEKFMNLHREHEIAAGKLRTAVISAAIQVDERIEMLIATHFCSAESQQLLLRSLLFQLGEITFSKKIEILKLLLAENYKDIYEQYSGIFNTIDSLRRLRNSFAHSGLAIRNLESHDPSKVFLRVVKDGKATFREINVRDARAIIAKSMTFSVLFSHIENEIRKRSSCEPNAMFEKFLETFPGILNQFQNSPAEKSSIKKAKKNRVSNRKPSR